MSISNISDLVQAYKKNTPADVNNPNKNDIATLQQKAEKYGVTLSQGSAKAQQQASIITHLFSNSNTAASDAMKLTYQAAISKLNEILSPQLGTDTPISQEALDKQEGIDNWSPTNTANRIVSGATAFLDGFKKIHPELQGQALMDKFQEVVGGGLQKGFDEAQGILKSLKVFDGTIKDNFTSTVDLVKKGMTNFSNQYLGIKTDSESTAEDAQATDETDNSATSSTTAATSTSAKPVS